MQRSISRLLVLTVLLGALAVLGPAAAPASAAVTNCSGFTSTAGRCVNAPLAVGAGTYSTDWYLPTTTPSAVMVLQHGFSRGCGNLRGLSRTLMEARIMVVCLNADMTGGNPTLANALGDAIAAGSIRPPDGSTMPTRVIVGGHSAGGHFAGVLGARLAALSFTGLRGAVLFDPVAQSGFSAHLAAVAANGSRPVLTVAARPAAINLSNNAFGALKALPNAFVGLQLVWSGYRFGWPFGGSCHTDAEGENSDLVAALAAGCSPASTNVSRLRELAAVWTTDMAAGTRNAAYYCTDAAQRATCGSRISSLVGTSLPVAALIPVS